MKINEIVNMHGERGMRTIADQIGDDTYFAGVQKLLSTNMPILIVTGFWVNGKPETDGPAGAYFLAKALRNLGKEVVIISDILSAEYFPKITYQHVSLENASTDIKLITDKYKDYVCISCERVGKSADYRYYNMRSVDISTTTAPLDIIVEGSKYSVCIGDGGNEIGMGNILAYLANMDIIPCVVFTNELVCAGVSNWGAYGIVRALEILLQVALLPDKHELSNYFRLMQSLGAIDGISKKNDRSEDGFSLDIGQDILARLKAYTGDNRFDK